MKKCIFVLGSEGTGSKFIAKTVSTTIGNDSSWNGSGFNCCNDTLCDTDNVFLHPCKNVQNLVCHRSMPFGKNVQWPPVEKWIEEYDCYFVLCTRDIHMSEFSRIKRFNRGISDVREHNEKTKEIFSELIHSSCKNFIWSYETFMFLKEGYLHSLFKFLGIKPTNTRLHINDGNTKYLTHEIERTIMIPTIVDGIRVMKSNKFYRLGDLMLRSGMRWEQDRNVVLNEPEYEGSLLREYLEMLEDPINGRFNALALKKTIAKQCAQKSITTNDNAIYIHLRTGDILLAGKRFKDAHIFNSEKLLSKIGFHLLKNINLNEVVIVTAMHFGDNEMNGKWIHDTNIEEENKKLISEILKNIFEKHNLKLSLLPSNGSNIENVDNHFLTLSIAKTLIADQGMFSKIIKKIKRNHVACNTITCGCPATRAKYSFRYIDEDRKFIYYNVPKNASTTLREFFFNNENKHSTAPPSMKLKDYYKFAIVRNPWSRMVSIWREFIKPSRIEQLSKSGVFIVSTISFRDFIKLTLEFDNHHWQPQSDFIPENTDFIGRFENFEEDFNIICEKIGVARCEVPHSNKTNHAHYVEYYDDDTRELVGKMFSGDIERFGYSFES